MYVETKKKPHPELASATLLFNRPENSYRTFVRLGTVVIDSTQD